MRNLLAAGIAALLYGIALAQSPATPANGAQAQSQETANPRLAAGSVIPVQLTKTIDAKKARTGEEIVAKVTQDMKGQNGELLLPKNAEVIGHVTDVQARNKEQKESHLAVAFDHAVVKGEQVQMAMSIQAVVNLQSGNNNNGGAEEEPNPSSTGTAGSSPMAGRSPMGGSAPQPRLPSAPSDDSGAQPAKLPPINAQTKGVIGISNLTLGPAANSVQGSVLTSEKNNVKLESGTMLLLRVDQ